MIFFIHNVYTSSTRQKAVKCSKQSCTRQFLYFPHNQTLPFKPTSRLSLPSGRTGHYHLDLFKTLLGLLRHTLFPRKLVASQIHLPARQLSTGLESSVCISNCVNDGHDPRVPVRGPRSAALFFSWVLECCRGCWSVVCGYCRGLVGVGG